REVSRRRHPPLLRGHGPGGAAARLSRRDPVRGGHARPARVARGTGSRGFRGCGARGARSPGPRALTDLSVSLVNTGNRELLLACLGSLTGGGQPPTELVVLDNASEDGSVAAVRGRFPPPLVSTLGLVTVGKGGVKQSRGNAPRPVDWVMGAALVLRREALEQIGLFDEDFFLYSEEVDLQFRLRRAGWQVHYFPSATVVHHESQFSAEIPERRINEMWRSRHRYWRKHHGSAGARVAALATGAQYAVRAIGAPLAGQDPRRMLLHARDSWRVSGPGLRELADEWNRHVGAASER